MNIKSTSVNPFEPPKPGVYRVYVNKAEELFDKTQRIECELKIVDEGPEANKTVRLNLTENNAWLITKTLRAIGYDIKDDQGLSVTPAHFIQQQFYAKITHREWQGKTFANVLDVFKDRPEAPVAQTPPPCFKDPTLPGGSLAKPATPTLAAPVAPSSVVSTDVVQPATPATAKMTSDQTAQLIAVLEAQVATGNTAAAEMLVKIRAEQTPTLAIKTPERAPENLDQPPF